MKRRTFVKRGALFVPAAFSILRSRGQALTLRDVASVRKAESSESCSTPASGALWNEGFQTASTGYELSGWTSVGTPDPAAARPGTQSPVGLCSQSLRCNPSGSARYAYRDEGTSRAELVIRFYMYFVTGDAAAPIIAQFQNSTTYGASPVTGIQAYTNGSNIQLRARGGATDSSWITGITKNAWHYVEMHINNGTTGGIKVDGGTEQTFTCLGANCRYYFFGIPEASVTADIYYDMIAVSTGSTYIGP